MYQPNFLFLPQNQIVETYPVFRQQNFSCSPYRQNDDDVQNSYQNQAINIPQSVQQTQFNNQNKNNTEINFVPLHTKLIQNNANTRTKPLIFGEQENRKQRHQVQMSIKPNHEGTQYQISHRRGISPIKIPGGKNYLIKQTPQSPLQQFIKHSVSPIRQMQQTSQSPLRQDKQFYHKTMLSQQLHDQKQIISLQQKSTNLASHYHQVGQTNMLQIQDQSFDTSRGALRNIDNLILQQQNRNQPLNDHMSFKNTAFLGSQKTNYFYEDNHIRGYSIPIIKENRFQEAQNTLNYDHPKYKEQARILHNLNEQQGELNSPSKYQQYESDLVNPYNSFEQISNKQIALQQNPNYLKLQNELLLSQQRLKQLNDMSSHYSNRRKQFKEFNQHNNQSEHPLKERSHNLSNINTQNLEFKMDSNEQKILTPMDKNNFKIQKLV